MTCGVRKKTRLLSQRLSLSFGAFFPEVRVCMVSVCVCGGGGGVNKLLQYSAQFKREPLINLCSSRPRHEYLSSLQHVPGGSP